MAEKQTFAFQAPDPVQGRPSAQGGYNIAQTVGGNVIGGDRSGIGPDQRGAVIGSFLDGLLEPYAKRKSTEAFAKGMADQMYAEAGEEIRAGNGLLTQVFGPSSYEEGAIFYEAQQRVAKVQNDWAAEEDELKTLDSTEVAKRWANKLEEAKVGDTFLDSMIQDTLVKASPQMLQTVAKARYGYQQERAARAQSDAWAMQGDALQAQGASLANTSDNETVAGYQAAVRSFTDLFVPLKGQADESFKKNLTGTMRTLIQRGDGHAVSALLRSNALDLLDEDDRARIEQLYSRSGRNALAKAAASPKMLETIDDLNGALAYGRVTPKEAIAKKRAINEQLKRMTGFDEDYFDASDQASTSKSVWEDLAAADRRQEDRAFQIQREEDRQQHEREMEDLKAQGSALRADQAWLSASPALAVASGTVDSSAMKARIYKGYLDNDFAGLDRTFRDALVGDGIKDAIKNTISSSVSSGYTPEFEQLVRKFDGMVKTNPAMAKEYFGSAFAPMRQYQKMRTTGANANVAFATSFGDDSQYAPSGGQIAKANKEIMAAVDAQQPWLPSWVTGTYGLNKSARRTLGNLVAREVASDKSGAGEDLSDKDLINAAINRVNSVGTFETAGPFGWKNPQGQQPMWRAMGAPNKQVADRIILEQIDATLRNRGYEAGAGGDEYQIVRSIQGGKPVLSVVPVDEDNGPDFSKGAVITVAQLKNAMSAKLERDNKAKGILKPDDLAWARIDPQRRIKGESVMDRVTRINREVKLRMDAGIPMYPVD